MAIVVVVAVVLIMNVPIASTISTTLVIIFIIEMMAVKDFTLLATITILVAHLASESYIEISNLELEFNNG